MRCLAFLFERDLMKRRDRSGIVGTILKSATMMALGFAAVTIPVRLLVRRELGGTATEMQSQGWPIQLAELLFIRYVLPWMEVDGIENLPAGSYLVAANHGWKSGLDGFLLGHLLATRAGRVPRIVMTGDARSWTVSAERWLLHHYGIALLTPRPNSHLGLTDVIAKYLRANDRHSVIIFPAGRAEANPDDQLKTWSSGVVVSARKSQCPIVPVAIGGPALDATPETLLLAALHAEGAKPPFRIQVRIGKAIEATDDTKGTLEALRGSVAELMNGIESLRSRLPIETEAAALEIKSAGGNACPTMHSGIAD